LPLTLLATALRGFCMGMADIVPGVSGGTVALVFGIYERLLLNVRMGAKALGSLAKLDIAGFKERFMSVEWVFIVPLAVGIGVALAALSSTIEGLLKDRPEEMAGLFFGLVVGSIVVAWGLVRERSSTNVTVMLAVGAICFYLLGFQSAPSLNPPLWAFFGAGAIAICAMILPGISGSFLLLMMGMYATVLKAVHSVDVAPLIVFGIGAVLGLALFSTGLGWLLERYHDAVLAVLIGLMIGSFRVLWPWPNGVGIISEEASEAVSGTGIEMPTGDNALIPCVLAAVAAAIVIAITRLAPASAVDHEKTPQQV